MESSLSRGGFESPFGDLPHGLAHHGVAQLLYGEVHAIQMPQVALHLDITRETIFVFISSQAFIFTPAPVRAPCSQHALGAWLVGHKKINSMWCA